MASRVKSRPTNSSRKPKRPARTKTKPKSKPGGPFVVKDFTSRYLVLLLDVGERIASAQGCPDAEQAERLRSEIQAFDNNTSLLLRDLDGKSRPQVGDLVLGELFFERGKHSVLCRLYGKVIDCDDRGNVRVHFEHYEYESDDGEDWDKEAAKCLNKEFTTHATDMDWSEHHKEWVFDLPN
jgi:hypothetical protein